MSRRMSMDVDAVARLAGMPFSPLDKGSAPQWWGRTPAEVFATRPHLLNSDAVLPLLTLDSPAVAHNVALLAQWVEQRSALLAPHVKTTMAPQLLAQQVERGAWAATVATASQLAALRAFGVQRLLVANPLLEPSILAWVADEQRRDDAFELFVLADSVTAVELMSACLRAAGAPRPVGVLVELGASGGRTDSRDVNALMDVALAVRGTSALTLVGVAGWEGAFASDRSATSTKAVDDYLRRLRAAVLHLAGRDLLDTARRVLVSAGGSLYFDRVVDILSGWPDDLPVVLVLRSGAYVTHDDGHYDHATPFTGEGGQDPFTAALRAWARVLSRPEPALVLLGLGKRDVPFDEGLPKPLDIRYADGDRASAGGLTVTAINDQHAFLRVPADARLRPGDVVRLGISHPCTAFDKWRVLLVLDDDERVVGAVRTLF